MSKPARPTLAHVAKAANVSITTASAALRGAGRVSPETRELVLAAARSIGYRTNSGASSLRSGAGAMVGLVLETDAFDDNPRNPKLFWPRLLNGFASELNTAGMGVALVSRASLGTLSKLPIDAVVVLADLVDELTGAMPFGMPIIGGARSTPNVAATAAHDYPAVTAECRSHLEAQGATSVALVMPEAPVPTIEATYELFRAEFAEHGMAVHQIGSAPEAVEFALDSGVDAIITPGENLPEIIATVTASGRAIPADVLLLSLSEGDLEAVLDPAVTTMSFLGRDSGRALGRLVCTGLATGDFQSVTLPHVLRPRASTAPR